MSVISNVYLAATLSLLLNFIAYSSFYSKQGNTSSKTLFNITNPSDRFLFCSDRTGNFEIYRIVNGKLTQLTDDPQYDSWWPRIAPDSSQILFYRTPVKSRPRLGGAITNYSAAALWMMKTDGSERVEITPQGAHGWLEQGVAKWSPDGKKFLMAARSSQDKRWHLYVTDTYGQNPKQISRGSLLYLDPAWSPDGHRIVYCAFPKDYVGLDLSHLEIFIADADGSNEKRITDDRLRDNDPVWSPDGKEIAFETQVSNFMVVGKWALRAIHSDGTSLRTILDDSNINTAPHWSKDSTIIYFHRFVLGTKKKFAIWSINADGTNLVQLTPGGNYDDSDVEPY